MHNSFKIGLFITLLLQSLSGYSAPGLSQNEQNQLLAVHNQWRRSVNVPLLNWSPAIADQAQNYADSLDDCAIRHSHTGLGENLYWASPVNYSDGTSEVQSLSLIHISEPTSV